MVVKMIHSTTMSNHSKLAHSMATMHRGQRMSSQQIKSGVFCPGTLSQNRRARTSNKHVTLLVTSNTSVIHHNIFEAKRRMKGHSSFVATIRSPATCITDIFGIVTNRNHLGSDNYPEMITALCSSSHVTPLAGNVSQVQFSTGPSHTQHLQALLHVPGWQKTLMKLTLTKLTLPVFSPLPERK